MKDLESGKVKIGPFGNIQLSFSGIEKIEQGQKGIERFFDGSIAKKESGGMKVEVENKKRKGAEEMNANGAEWNGGDSSKVPENEQVASSSPKLKKKKLDPVPTITCAKCTAPIPIPSSAFYTLVESELDRDQLALKVEEMKKKETMEHLDWHFGRDLLERDRERSRPSNKVTKKEGKKEGKSKLSEKKKVGQTSLKGFFKS